MYCTSLPDDGSSVIRNMLEYFEMFYNFNCIYVLYRLYTKEWCGNSAFYNWTVFFPPTHTFSQECMGSSQSYSSTALYRTCCKRDNHLLPWLPGSPDLTPCYFFVWVFFKDSVYVPPLPMSLKELRGRITHTLQTIKADMLHRVWDEFDYRVDVCRVTQGAHIKGL